MNNLLESSNYKLVKSDETHFIDDINLLLKQYENILNSSNSNKQIILNGSLICEYMLNLFLQKKGFLFKKNASLAEIVEFSKENKIVPNQCCSFLDTLEIYRKNNDIEYQDGLTNSFLKAFAYYITWFNNSYSKDNLFHIKNCFNIINSKFDSKLFNIDNVVEKTRLEYDDFSAEIDDEKFMICPGCGSEIESDCNFCPHCRYEFLKKYKTNIENNKTLSKTLEVEKQDKRETQLNNDDNDKQDESSVLKMLNEQNETIKTILETVLKKLELVENIDAKLDVISNNLNRIQSQSEKLIKTALSEEEIDRIIEVHTTEYVENIFEYEKEISKDKEFKQEKIKLMELFSQETWFKLSNDSKICLIMARFMYNKFITLDEIIDYSGVCVLITKALEIEIYKRFFTNFIEFLDKKYNKDYNQYPTALLYQGTVPLKPEQYTMGNIAFVLCKKENCYDNEKQIKNNKEKLLEYCHECLFSNKSTEEIEKLLDSYASSIEMIRIKYRNPSAHINHIKRNTAKDCFDLIIDNHKLLKEMIDSFDE